MVFDDGGVGEAHGEGVHSLVERALHEEQRVFPEEVRYRTGIATFEQFPFVQQNEPVRFRVGRENGGFAEHVGGEDWTVAFHALVHEGFRVVTLVS